jgi:hypothetical protein
MAQALWLRAVAGGNLHRSREPSGHLLQGCGLDAAGPHRGQQPAARGILRTQRASEKALGQTTPARRARAALRRQLGLRRRRGSASTQIPGYETFSDLLARLDIEALGCVLTAWLGEHRGTLPAHLALDGKHIREHLGTIVTLCDIQEQVPVAVRATVEKGGEQSASRALLRSEQVSLLESTASLDNLYANPENARLIVQEQGGDYLISLKDNQPTLAAYATAQLAGAPFLPPNLKCAAANSSSAS